jgi:hypothetical protein
MNKKITPLIVGVGVILAMTVMITVYVGVTLTGRWRPFAGLDEARAALKELPMQIGDWQAEKEGELDATSITMLRIQDSYVYRVYKNARTQAVVHLTIMVGPTGIITVHTPEICFGGKDYDKDGTRTRIRINVQREEDEIDDFFWRTNFTGRSLDTNNRISFYYAVSPGDTWNAVEVPRATYQTYRFVYKLQAEALTGTDGSGDTVKNFLEDCLPTIHEYMRPCN